MHLNILGKFLTIGDFPLLSEVYDENAEFPSSLEYELSIVFVSCTLRVV
jgi:hypothetical protein